MNLPNGWGEFQRAAVDNSKHSTRRQPVLTVDSGQLHTETQKSVTKEENDTSAQDKPIEREHRHHHRHKHRHHPRHEHRKRERSAHRDDETQVPCPASAQTDEHADAGVTLVEPVKKRQCYHRERTEVLRDDDTGSLKTETLETAPSRTPGQAVTPAVDTAVAPPSGAERATSSTKESRRKRSRHRVPRGSEPEHVHDPCALPGCDTGDADVHPHDATHEKLSHGNIAHHLSRVMRSVDPVGNPVPGLPLTQTEAACDTKAQMYTRDSASDVFDAIRHTISSQLNTSLQEVNLVLDTILSRVPYQNMLETLFGGQDTIPDNVPVVTRVYEESFMRESLNTREKLCALGKGCECMFIDTNMPFVGTEFLLPGEESSDQPQMCVLCCRKVTQQLFHDMVFSGDAFRAVIQRYGNICDQPGEYARECVLVCPPNAPVQCMPLPIVAHQRNRYTVLVQNGIKYLKQQRVYYEDFVDYPAHCAVGCIHTLYEDNGNVPCFVFSKAQHIPYSVPYSTSAAVADTVFTTDAVCASSQGGVYTEDGSGSDARGRTVFCKGSLRLDSELRELHASLLRGNLHAQIHIDARVIACVMADHGWSRHPVYRHVPVEWLIMPVHDTLSHRLLPDLMRFMTRCITNQSWTDGVLERLLHNALPCLKRGRVFNNPFAGTGDTVPEAALRGAQAPPRAAAAHIGSSEYTACLHILQALLLGLYSGNTKKPLFSTRADIIFELRRLCTSNLETQRRFLSSVPSLVKLSFMEYVVNVSSLVCPNEVEQFLRQRGMDVYYQTCSNVCDNFRMEALQGAKWSWDALEARAGMVVERFVRTCKFRVQKQEGVQRNQLPVRQILTMWRRNIASGFVSNEESARIVELALAAHYSDTPGMTMHVLDTLTKDAGDPMLHSSVHTQQGTARHTVCNVVESIQKHMRCFMMPQNLVRQYTTQLMSRFGSEPYRMFAHSKLNICMQCLVRSPANAMKHKLRLDVNTQKLSCSYCSSDSVVEVNMLGRWLKINNLYYMMCPTCLKVVPWRGVGNEFSANSCCHGASPSRQTQKKSKEVETQAVGSSCELPPCVDQRSMWTDQGVVLRKCTTTQFFQGNGMKCNKYKCVWCERSNAHQFVHVLHIPWRKFVTVQLCNRHSVAEHLRPYVYDTLTLCRILKNKKA